MTGGERQRASKGARLSSTWLTILSCAAIVPASSVQGAEQTPEASQRRIVERAFEEIVITARKRAENLQVVPIAITALSPRDLETRNVQTVADLKFVAPSLQVEPDTFRQDTINITIRGIRNFPGSGIQYDTAASVYVNGIYYARTQGLTGALFDIENIQVLKGPQGTLVGRNATGGAVLYTTNEPQPEFGGSVQFVVGDYGRYEGQAIVNMPLTDKIFARAAVSATESAGYLRNEYFNPTTGERNDTPGLGSRKKAGLFSLRFDMDDQSKLVLRGDFDIERHTGSSYHLLDYFEGGNPSTGNIGANAAPVVRPSICQIPTTCGRLIDLKGRVIDPYYADVATRAVNTSPAAYNALLNVLARHKADFWLIDQADMGYNAGSFQSVSAAYDRDFDWGALRVLGGYRWFSTEAISISRGAPYDTIQNPSATPDYRAYTLESTLSGSALENSVDWTIGAFFFKENSGDQLSSLYLFSTNQLQPQAIAGRQITGAVDAVTGGVNTSYAPYAQASYEVLPQLRATLGLRYSFDERSSRTAQPTLRFPATLASTAAVANAVFDPGAYILNGISYTGITRTCGLTDVRGVLLSPANCTRSIEDTFQKLTYTVSLDYDIADDALLYATARKGYKSGALDASAANPVFATAAPEVVQDYEVGLKSDWYAGDVAFRTNFSAYLSEYKNQQTQVAVPFVLPATGPGGVGACTQELLNRGQCLGVQSSNITMNAALSRIYGGEWDLNVKPTPAWTMSWNGSYMRAKYIDFSFSVPPGFLQPAAGVSLAGKHFPLPAWTMSGSSTYTLAGENIGLPADEISFTYNIYWQSDFKTDLAIYNALQKVKGYAMSGLRIGVQNIADTGVSVSGTVSNLFNRRACQGEPGGTSGGAGVIGSTPNSTFGVPGTSGLVQCVPLPPRMIAATVRYAF